VLRVTEEICTGRGGTGIWIIAVKSN